MISSDLGQLNGFSPGALYPFALNPFNLASSSEDLLEEFERNKLDAEMEAVIEKKEAKLRHNQQMALAARQMCTPRPLSPEG